jgi:hypothetical protein
MLLKFVEPMHIHKMYTSVSRPLLDSRVCCVKRTVSKHAISCMQMGPVTTAVGLYALERLMTRIMAGQIHRRGIIRKMRRLMFIVLEFHMLCEIIQDVMEDVLTQ